MRDIRVGDTGSSPSELTAVGELVFFRASDSGGGATLWVSDGSEMGTRELVFPTSSSHPLLLPSPSPL